MEIDSSLMAEAFAVSLSAASFMISLVAYAKASAMKEDIEKIQSQLQTLEVTTSQKVLAVLMPVVSELRKLKQTVGV